MRRLAITTCFGLVFGAYLYIVCGSLDSQIDKTDSSSRQKKAASTSDQESTPLKVLVSTTQEITHLEPVDKEPKAKITAPTSVSTDSYVVLDFTGTVSSIEPDFDIVFSPEGSKSFVTKLYHKNHVLAYGLLVPDKAGKYRIALVAFATDDNKANTVRSYAFVDIDVTEPSKPKPEPLPKPPGPTPEPPLPVPTPPEPKQEDTYGMKGYTQSILDKMSTEDKWQSRIPLIYDSFDKMIAQSSSFTDATKFVQATSDLYKSALGSDYNYFSHYFFTPLKTQLGKINASGKLPSTVEAHTQAWKEISQALHQVKLPASSSRTR
jgi:hypothetical protein